LDIADVSRKQIIIIAAIMKTQMQLVLGKKHLGNERIYKNKCLPNSESLNFT